MRSDEEQEQKDAQILHIAGLAKELLGNPLWKQVFELLLKEYLGNIVKTKWADSETREALYRKYMTLKEVEKELTAAVSSGNIVEKRQEIADYQAAVVEEEKD